MSSFYTLSRSRSLRCRSCRFLADNSSSVGRPCPFCGFESITETTDPRSLSILGLLNNGSSHFARDVSSSNTEGDGDDWLHRSPFFPSHRRLSNVLAYLATISREASSENARDHQHYQTRESPSLPSTPLSPVSEVDASEEDRSYGLHQLFEEDYSHEGNEAFDISALHQQIQTFNTQNDVGENSERSSDSDEGALHPMLEYIVRNFAQAESGSAPASKAAVAALRTSQFGKKCNGDEAACCAVCKEVFKCGEEVKEMPCEHIFHSGCILPWLKLHSSCPLCRGELPVEENPGDSTEDTVGARAEDGGTIVALFESTGGGIVLLSFA